MDHRFNRQKIALSPFKSIFNTPYAVNAMLLKYFCVAAILSFLIVFEHVREHFPAHTAAHTAAPSGPTHTDPA